MEHFFERLERKIDLQGEYEKLEELFCVRNLDCRISLQSIIELNFLKWQKRGNYISLKEIRKQINLPYEKVDYGYKYRKDIDINDFLLFCEMVLNLLKDFMEIIGDDSFNSSAIILMDTIRYDLEIVGEEIKTIDDKIIIVSKDAAAYAVVEIVPELDDVIIEYNHFLLKGNLERKKELLKKIADSLEPRRDLLKKLNKTAVDDFFFLVNKMNIRHNNCDPSDEAKYCKSFDEMSISEKEDWYDLIYNQALMLYILFDYQSRKEKIRIFKDSL